MSEQSTTEDLKRKEMEALYAQRLSSSRIRNYGRTEVSKEGYENDSAVKATSGYVKSTSGIIKQVEGGHEIKALAGVLKLATTLRKDANEHKKAPWIFVLVIAIIGDVLAVTWILGALITFGLFFFLWGRGKWKWRILRNVLLFLDIIPFLSLVPLSTTSVIFCWYESNKKYKKSLEELEKIKKKYGKRVETEV